MVQVPFDAALLWRKLQEAFNACSNSQLSGMSGLEMGIWFAMISLGLLAGLGLQFKRYLPLEPQASPNSTPPSNSIGNQKDLGLYTFITIICGTAGYICFLLIMKFPTEPWYYLGMFCLCAISLDAVLGASWRALRPWGFLRIGLAAVLLLFGVKSVWDEAQTRRTNVDLIADVLTQKADNGDLIVVQGAWEALTLDRYYHGPCRWISVPPIDAHKVHRTDLMWEMMNQKDPMKPVLDDINATLKHNKSIWVVGYLAAGKPLPRPADTQQPRHRWLGEYIWNWITELTAHLSQNALDMKIVAVPVDRPVSRFENLPLMRFSGYADSEKARLDSALTKH
jgi:hypothetical protein